MINYVLFGVLAVILGVAIFYIYRAKKSGKKCIGCPGGASCSGGCSGCNGQCGK